MITFNDYYYIAESEVEAILKEVTEGDFPYRLTVRTKAGRDYVVRYKDKRTRDNSASNIEYAVRCYNANQNPSLDRLREIMHDEVNKLRPYLRRIEKSLKEVKTND